MLDEEGLMHIVRADRRAEGQLAEMDDGARRRRPIHLIEQTRAEVHQSCEDGLRHTCRQGARRPWGRGPAAEMSGHPRDRTGQKRRLQSHDGLGKDVIPSGKAVSGRAMRVQTEHACRHGTGMRFG